MAFLTSAPEGDEGSAHAPVASSPDKQPPVPVGEVTAWVPDPVRTQWRRNPLPGSNPGHTALRENSGLGEPWPLLRFIKA
jgi:hypothetical protein